VALGEGNALKLGERLAEADLEMAAAERLADWRSEAQRHRLRTGYGVETPDEATGQHGKKIGAVTAATRIST